MTLGEDSALISTGTYCTALYGIGAVCNSNNDNNNSEQRLCDEYQIKNKDAYAGQIIE
jgi:hypothetical protein